MAGLDPFEPDDIYCVHCHAPAAGMCAECGALCCADCVELRLGLTRERAVCRVCLQAAASHDPEPRRWSPWWIAVGAGVALLLWWLL